MPGPADEFRALTRAVKEYEGRFLSAYLGSPPELAAPSRAEELDVAAYAVLTHGALENFVEGVALWVLDRSVANWTMKKRVTRSTASLLLFQVSPGISDTPTSIFDNLRSSLAEAKEAVSKRIHENNGVTPRHLRELFYPLGVDVPTDAVQTASVELLVGIRHQWAHQYRYGAKVVKPAKDVQLAVTDCIKFADDLRKKAAAVKP